MSDPTGTHSQAAIFRFWAPLSVQWLMMSLEGPFLAAVIARMAEPTVNLAAYGVAFAFAMLFESPIIMLMSASVALVTDGRSYRLLRNFSTSLNAGCTALLLVMLVPPVYDAVLRGLLALPAPVASEVYGALWLLLPWPAAIGYRRFLHGILIRAGHTRLVAYGTVLRLTAMAGAGLALSIWTGWSGAHVGAAALSAGVVAEALATTVMALGTVRRLRAGETLDPAGRGPARAASELEAAAGVEEVAAAQGAATRGLAGRGQDDVPTYASIGRFYFPLALTSLLGLAVQPILTFFMGRAPAPVESLAVFPVVHAVSFFFRAPGISFQEVAIALIGERREHLRPLARFGAGMAIVTTGGMAILAFTPLADVWFVTISGLSRDLADAAITPFRIALLLPPLTVLISLQQAILVQARRTRPITIASAVEVAGLALLFGILGWGIGIPGAAAAFAGLGGGRIAANLYLHRSVRRLTAPPAPRPAVASISIS
jgi:Na+-driven multidrug efflux pump